MSTTKQTLKLFWEHSWRYPRYVVGLLIMIPVGTITFRLLPPLIAAALLQRLSKHAYTSDGLLGNLTGPVISYAAITIFGGFVAWRIIIYLTWKLEGHVEQDLYRAMFDQFLRLSASYHASNFGGSMVSRTAKLAGSYVRLTDTLIFQAYGLLINFVFIALVLVHRAPYFVLALLIFSAVFVFLTNVLSRRVRELSVLEANSQNRTTGYLADAITNVLAIKSFATGAAERTRFAETTVGTMARNFDVMRASIKRDAFASSITTLVQSMAAFFAVALVLAHKSDVATVFLMFTYSVTISDALWTFSTSTLRNYNRSIGDSQEAALTLSEKPEVLDPESPELVRIRKGEVAFQQVTFDHGDSTNRKDTLFKDFNLCISSGEKIGLVGHSGGGKTTLTKLILRFMDVDAGEITIDGQNIAIITQDDLRRHITYVPQEPLLFHRSLAENISYGKPNASQHEVIRASKLAHAHEFIKDLPDGYETLVGERGVKLSGGQRQRVVIARAMLKQAPVLLLDEATSALDSESEVLIQDALWKLMEGRTAIVIAHRLSTVQKMDRIIVLEQGRIVEQGSHKELLAKNGTYAKLWAHQSGGFIEE